MNEKTKQILAYIFSPIGGLIFFLLNDSSKETKYHAAQSMVIGGIAFIISFIPFINFIAALASLVFIILGIVRAVNEEDPKIPLISNIVDMIFVKEFGKAEETTGTTKEVDAEIKDAETETKTEEKKEE